MKKLLLSVLLILVSLVSLGSVDAVGFQSGTTISLTPSAADPVTTVAGSLSVDNNCINPASVVTITSTDLILSTDASVKIAAPVIPSLSNMAASEKRTVSFNIAVPAIRDGIYNGKITLNAVYNTGSCIITDEKTYSLVVNPKTRLLIADGSGSEASELLITGQEDQTVTGTLYVKNTGSTSLALIASNFAYDAAKFTKDNRAIGLSFENIPASIAPGENKAVTVKAAIPSNMKLNTYSDNLTLNVGTASDSMTLKVRVQPEVCSNSVIGDLRIDVTDPDNNDEYSPGETISLKVNVDNVGSKDLDVIVEAFLYDVSSDDEIVREESDSDNIDNGKDVDFKFGLDVPDDQDLDEDDDYILYVKAYEDGSEDDHCAQDSVSIDIVRNTYDVVVKRIDIRPQVVQCGDVVNVDVSTENRGSKKITDAYVEVKEGTLGIGERTSEFTLEKYSDSDNSELTKRFTFKIPENVKTGDYMIESIVYYKSADKSNSKFATLKVTCEDETAAKTVKLSLTSSTSSFDVSETSGKLHILVSNSETKDLTGTIEVNPIGSWAGNIAAQTISLHPGDNNFYYDLPLKATSAGKQSANVVLRVPGYDVKQFTLNFDVSGVKEESALNKALGSSTLLVIGYAVLVLIGIYFLKLIFSRPKHKSLI